MRRSGRGETEEMQTIDAQLIERTRDGESEAFGELVGRYRDMVYGLCYHLCGNFEEARDLAQEAFIQAYLKLEQLRDTASFTGWLRQIAINLHKSQTRTPKVMTVVLEEEAEPLPQDEPSGIEAVVQEALQKLKEPERLALTLQYINGYSQAEIGQFLGVRTETVKTRVARARQHLKEEMMAMVEETFNKKKLPEEFAQETVEAAIQRADELQKKGELGNAYWAYRDITNQAGFGPTIRTCEAILQQNPEHAPTHLALGFAMWQAGEPEKALQLFQKILVREPYNQLAYMAIEQLLTVLQRYEELSQFHEERQKTRPWPEAYYHTSLAQGYIGLRDMASAERELRLALAAESHNAQEAARAMLANILMAREAFAEATALLETNVAEAPDSTVAAFFRMNLCRVHYYAGHYEQAIAAIRDTLLKMDVSPKMNMTPEACLYLLERCFFATGRLDEFPAISKELADHSPNPEVAGRLRWYLALFLESRLMGDEARMAFEQLGAIPAQCWRVIVPFGGEQANDMSTIFPPEQEINLAAVYPGKLGIKLHWQRPYIEGLGFELDLHQQIATSAIGALSFPWGVGYAYLEVASSKARNASFRFGASGSSEVWVNGKSVFAGISQSTPDTNVASISLKRGRNGILVKIGVSEESAREHEIRGGHYVWSLFSRITDEAGEPMRDLKFPLGEK
jgi:RNA polymerase sigma factor (sigma-70 family)